jgi:uncharacterized membrane protein
MSVHGLRPDYVMSRSDNILCIANAAHATFAATFIALGIFGLVQGDFAAIWQPVPKSVPGRELLSYLCACVSLGSGIGLIVRRSATAAARVLLAYLLLWMLLFKITVVIHAPTQVVSFESCAETAVLAAGAWALYASLANDWDRRRLGFATGSSGLRIARSLYGLALIAFGLAHFAYVTETASLVPSWLPGHNGWAYFTGSSYIAAGIAVLAARQARAAVSLVALQMALFTLLVWIPAVVATTRNAAQWSETVLSFALTVGAWVIADSYRSGNT